MDNGSGEGVAPESFRFFLLYARPREVLQILTDGAIPLWEQACSHSGIGVYNRLIG